MPRPPWNRQPLDQALASKPPWVVVAEVLGISERRLATLFAEGSLPKDGTLLEILHAYCARLSDAAAGRGTSEEPDQQKGRLDLSHERALLVREQRRGQARKNAIAAGEFAAIDLLAAVLARASVSVAERFEHLPAKLKTMCPEMTSQQRDLVMGVIADARNEWMSSTVNLLTGEIETEPAEDDPSELAA